MKLLVLSLFLTASSIAQDENLSERYWHNIALYYAQNAQLLNSYTAQQVAMKERMINLSTLIQSLKEQMKNDCENVQNKVFVLGADDSFKCEPEKDDGTKK